MSTRRYFTPKDYTTWAIVVDDGNKTAMIQWEMFDGRVGTWESSPMSYDAWKGGEIANTHWQRHKVCSFRKWLRTNKFTELPR